MTRRSLRPHLNQIRTWVRQGRTDAWIAHQLEVTVQQIQVFKREQELEADGEPDATAEVDLRAEDDELIAAELEAEAARRAEEEARKAEEEAARAAEKEAAEKAAAEAAGADEADEKPKRRRATRSRRRKAAGPLEGTFDHGEEGYGLWLDPAVEDDPVYAEHWAGHRPVTVTIEEDQIVIRRANGDGEAAEG